MSVCILANDEQAAMYCSTSDVAFGPVFHSDHGKDASERIEAFLRWLPQQPAIRAKAMENDFFSTGRFDVRMLNGRDLDAAYSEWLAQEEAQYAAEEKAERERIAAEEAEEAAAWERSEREYADIMARRQA